MDEDRVRERGYVTNPRRFTTEQMILALTASGGVKKAAAAWLREQTGLSCSVQTVYNYINDFPEVAAALPQIKELTLDDAEIGLVALIRSRNLTAIMYYLNNHGQSRGYNVRPALYSRNDPYARAVAEAEAANNAATDYGLSNLTDEEFAILERAFARGGGAPAGDAAGAPAAGPNGGRGKSGPVH